MPRYELGIQGGFITYITQIAGLWLISSISDGFVSQENEKNNTFAHILLKLQQPSRILWHAESRFYYMSSTMAKLGMDVWLTPPDTF